MSNPFWISQIDCRKSGIINRNYGEVANNLCYSELQSHTNLIKCMVSINSSVRSWRGPDERLRHNLLAICGIFQLLCLIIALVASTMNWQSGSLRSHNSFLPLLWPLIKTTVYCNWLGFVDLTEATFYLDKWQKVKNIQNNIHIQLYIALFYFFALVSMLLYCVLLYIMWYNHI